MTVRDLTILGCSSQQPTRKRNHGAYLVRWNDEGLLFDPGEGTQRQFIFAEIAPTVINRIFISHFHGDHCLGLSSILMRLNLDNVQHPVHCYYPASGKEYFDRLKDCTIYHNHVVIIEHPVEKNGLVHDDGKFHIEAEFLDHSVDTIGWRIKEPHTRKFDREKLKQYKVFGPLVHKLKVEGSILIENREVFLDDVSWIREGDVLAVVIDTRLCPSVYSLSHHAKLFLCESTYLDRDKEMAYKHKHLTAKQAAEIAKKSEVEKLVLTHFSARYQNLKEFKQEARSIFPATEIGEDLKQISFPKN